MLFAVAGAVWVVGLDGGVGMWWCVRACRGMGLFVSMWCVFCCVSAAAYALSNGRVYEMVSPLYKGGYGAVFRAASPDGDNVAFNSLGVFAGIPRAAVDNAYLAHREEGKGWSTSPLQPPFAGSEVTEFSSLLKYALANHHLGENEGELLWHSLGTPDTLGSWEVFAPGVILRPVEAEFEGGPPFLIAYPVSASNDLCHVAVEGVNLSAEAPFASLYKLYDVGRGCRGEGPWLRLVGVRNRLGPHGEPEQIRGECTVEPGNVSINGSGPFGPEQNAMFNAVSGDGSEFFFTADAEEAKNNSTCSHQQLFVRVGGSRTVEVSRPVDPSLPFGGCGEGGSVGEVPGEVPCADAVSRMPSFFKGASEDGLRVFFTTGERLVAGDTDNTNKLYMARIGCPVNEPACEPAARRVTGLVDASQSQLAGETGEVQGVASMAKNGERVYFVAHGVLTGGPNGEGVVAVKGADNLYVYNAETGGVSFIADLCSGAGVSGSRDDARCPSSLSGGVNDTSLWGENKQEGEAQTAGGDGRFLVFSSFSQLIERGTQTDADDGKDVYRYDAVTGVLDRVSLGEAGHDAKGNGSGFDATIQRMGVLGNQAGVVAQQGLATRAISEDGSMVVFSSVEPLSSAAINHHKNIYIWQKQPGWSEGRVSLVSSGSSLTDDNRPVITPDGVNVFFTTSQGLVPVDTENDLDVYDARVGGGFPEAVAERVQCSSDACQGALTNPAPLLVPGSVSQAAGGNFPAPSVKHPLKKRMKKVKRVKKARRAGKSASGGGRARRSVHVGGATHGGRGA
jgi:hypothetical protein